MPRHAFATHPLGEGVHFNFIQEWLDQANLAATQVCMHWGKYLSEQARPQT
jgi:site-specific recombinase XerD